MLYRRPVVLPSAGDDLVVFHVGVFELDGICRNVFRVFPEDDAGHGLHVRNAALQRHRVERVLPCPGGRCAPPCQAKQQRGQRQTEGRKAANRAMLKLLPCGGRLSASSCAESLICIVADRYSQRLWQRWLECSFFREKPPPFLPILLSIQSSVAGFLILGCDRMR